MKALSQILIPRLTAFTPRQRAATIDFAISSTLLILLAASTATILTILAALNLTRATRRIRRAAPPVTE